MSMKWLTENLLIHKTILKSILAAAVCSIFIIASGCSLLPDETEEEVLPVITPPQLSQKPEYLVQTDTIETRVRGIGKLMSTKEESLYFTEDNKRVKEIYVNTGDQVEAGQLIAELDVAELSNQLRQLELQFRSEELQMIQTLRKADEISAEELEQAKISFELKRADLLELRESISRSKLVAPFSGTLVSLSIKKGDMTKEYDTVAIIADLAQLTVAAEISQTDLEKVAVSMEAMVDISGVGQQVGKVKQLPISDGNNNVPTDPWGNPINPDNQDSIENYLLVELNELPAGLNRGTPLSVSIIVQRKENVVVIPPSALRTHLGRSYVQVVDEDGSKREVDVEVGQQTSTQVEIVKGLEAGQKVVGR